MKTLLRILALIALALTGFLTYAGYFDREVLIDVPATGPPTPKRSRIAAVYFSGDVGYRLAMGRKTADLLAADGIPVVGMNSLAFFHSHRTIADVTELISTAIRRALELGHADQVILVGHSLGADALQAGLVDLPPALRQRIRAVVLIVPTRDLYLQVTPGEMFDFGRPDGAVLPTLRQLTWAPLTCIRGIEETDSPCTGLAMPNVRQDALPGGHQLRWDTKAVHLALFRAIDASGAANITNDSDRDNPETTRNASVSDHGQTGQGNIDVH
ncbi:MAG: AcvB/VirJ family lysyl-phosphatidylglycerol hydrolase [Novosphingobium sp.]